MINESDIEYSHRPLLASSIDAINRKLDSTDWIGIQSMSVNDSYNYLEGLIMETLDEFAPVEKTKIKKQKVIREKWVSKGLLKCSNKAQKLFKSQIGLDRDHPKHIKYIKYRNTLNLLRRKAKKDYYVKKIQESRNNMKKTWEILNAVIGKSRNKMDLTDQLKVNETTITNPNAIANLFGESFASIGKRCLDKMPCRPLQNQQNYHIEPIPQTMFMSPTDEHEISCIIRNLRNKNSSGHDGLSPSLIKMLEPAISKPLSIIFNKSLCEGIIPDKLKLAKVLPIFKKDDKELMDNYRPISILPSFSKILEKIVFKRVYNFLDKFKILHDSQYGFRPNRSTIDAIIDCTEQIKDALENKKDALGLFLDLSKAFDTLDHSILLKKLSLYGIRGQSLSWFQNYLDNRSLYVEYKGAISKQYNVTYGVPQGSVLGPLLFIIFINDLPQSINKSSTILFADDTTLLTTASNLDELFVASNDDANSLYNWFCSNNLSLNTAKTQYIVFTKKLCPKTLKHNLRIGDELIANVKEAKFLGMILDNRLNWHSHIAKIRTKLSSSIFGISRVKTLLPRHSLISLYYSMFQSFIDYGLCLWGGSHQSYVKQIFTMQKKVIRMINGLSYNDHTNESFYNLKILKLNELYINQIAKLSYRHHHLLLSKSLNLRLGSNRAIHPYETRHQMIPLVSKTD